ncbi:hypothetical protein AB0B45_47790 [Nonomuraea sp. NPDC049152]|uniref:hypothetical protein n=1 Tax=Nonomuraea sp. NPDC049152 TaxID=3154350 RepID=UPI00340EDA6B
MSRAASGRATDGPADVGHAEAGGRASGCLSHGLELLVSGGEGGLDGGDFTEPALILGLGETVDEVGVDLFESGLLSWVNAKEGASDAGVFMHARGSEVAAAYSERDLSQLENAFNEKTPTKCLKADEAEATESETSVRVRVVLRDVCPRRERTLLEKWREELWPRAYIGTGGVVFVPVTLDRPLGRRKVVDEAGREIRVCLIMGSRLKTMQQCLK